MLRLRCAQHGISFLSKGGLVFMALVRFRANGQGLLSSGFMPSSMDPGISGSADIDDMYPPPPSTTGPSPPHQQQPMGGGGGVGAISQPTYYPPPTFWQRFPFIVISIYSSPAGLYLYIVTLHSAFQPLPLMLLEMCRGSHMRNFRSKLVLWHW